MWGRRIWRTIESRQDLIANEQFNLSHVTTHKTYSNTMKENNNNKAQLWILYSTTQINEEKKTITDCLYDLCIMICVHMCINVLYG